MTFETVDIFTTPKKRLSRTKIAEVDGVKCFLSEFELTGTGEKAYGCHVVKGDEKAPYGSWATELYYQVNHALLESLQIAIEHCAVAASKWAKAVGLE